MPPLLPLLPPRLAQSPAFGVARAAGAAQTHRRLMLLRVARQPPLPTTTTTTSSVGGAHRRAIASNSISQLPIMFGLPRSAAQPRHRLHHTVSCPSEFAPDGTSANYFDDRYAAWLENASSVSPDLAAYFSNLESEPQQRLYHQGSSPQLGNFNLRLSGGGGGGGNGRVDPGNNNHDDAGFSGSPSVAKHLKLQLLVRAYQVRGHLLAALDPLEINATAALGNTQLQPPELDPAFYGFTAEDHDLEFELGPGVLPMFSQQSSSGARADGPPRMRLRDIIAGLRKTYCSSFGYEYMHILDRSMCDWLRERIERPVPYAFSGPERKLILERLLWSDHFERFVATKFPSEKRFGLEGCEALIPGMKALIDCAVDDSGVREIVLGMPHRGRLNVLSNVACKPNESIFCEFAGSYDPNLLALGSGDVKYHLGMTCESVTPGGNNMTISLVANPSHLEAVNPVVLGKTRAHQYYHGARKENTHPHENTENSSSGAIAAGSNNNIIPDTNFAMPVLLHGDASFAGQGVVYETLGFSHLPNYSVGGTIHIIVNNQIGFTTDPRFSRSTPYCSDLAKCVSAPIVHVNADDVEAVVFACRLAAAWRAKYHTDFVIDLIGYRRYGHNEVDQPMFTQPHMYKKIAASPRVADKHAAKLVAEGVLTTSELEEMKSRVWEQLNASYERSKTHVPTPQEWVSSTWHGMRSPKELATCALPPAPTGAPTEMLHHVGLHVSTPPSPQAVGSNKEESFDFNLHPLLKRILRARLAAFLPKSSEAKSTGTSSGFIDMATAEALAFGTLMLEHGTHVRVSGQDVERGTFSQRHAVLHDQEVAGRTYTPLCHVGSPIEGSHFLATAGGVGGGGDDGMRSEDPRRTANDNDSTAAVGSFSIANSSLSEFGVLGFELGYSLVHPNSLVVWEAQFGDFANNAQCIVDQFVASGEQKWMQRTGLVLNLPHGYDGQGPEHSSSRMERFLELVDEPQFSYPSEDALSRQVQDTNMQVCYPSTPANYFHALRRQVMRGFRKPLILAISKALLRHPLARSTVDELATGTSFRKVIADDELAQQHDPSEDDVNNRENITADERDLKHKEGEEEEEKKKERKEEEEHRDESTKRLVFCTGQVYYALLRAARANAQTLRDVVLVRVEQIAPFPFSEVREVLERHPLAKIIWAQEEPSNMGAWPFVGPRLRAAVKHVRSNRPPEPQREIENKDSDDGGDGGTSRHGQSLDEPVVYAGRPPSGAVATGSKKMHIKEERALMSEALFGSVRRVRREENGVPIYE